MPAHAEDPLAGSFVQPGPLERQVRSLVAEMRGFVQGPRLEPRLLELAAHVQAVSLMLRPEFSGRVVPDPDELYDHYFGIQRVEGLPAEVFAGQVLRTAAALFSDLPWAGQDHRDIKAALDAFAAMLSRAPELPVAEPIGTDWRGVWNDDPERLTGVVSPFRWRTGHHWLGICSFFCRVALVEATSAALDPAECGHVIKEAARFLKAATAAMAYATAFPFKLSLLAPMPQDGGFWGIHNPDYDRMKTARFALRHRLFELYGRRPGRWPEPVRIAMRDFHETDLLDLDRQCGLAEFKPAVEHLRELAELRRKEFDFSDSDAVMIALTAAEAQRTSV